MRLDENFTLENDTNCWTLVYAKISDQLNDKGNPIVSRGQTYHGSIKAALISYCDKALKPCESIVETLEKIDILEKKIQDIFELHTAEIN